jgi:hypothetical protein
VSIIQRCFLSQVFAENELENNPNLPKPNLEKCYMKLSITLDKAINPIIGEI